MDHTESSIIHALVMTAIIASIAIVYAFIKPAYRALQGSHDFGDLLASGIWARALGTICTSTATLIILFFRVDPFWLLLTGWCLVIIGYLLHFIAWQMAYYSTKPKLYGLVAALLCFTWAVSFKVLY